MNQINENTSDARLQEIERKLNLLVDFVCGGRTSADIQIERLGCEFQKFRWQLGFGTEMLLQMESAMKPQRTEAQFIEAGLPSLPDMLADLTNSIANALTPSNPGPEVIDGGLPSLPDMLAVIQQRLERMPQQDVGDEGSSDPANGGQGAFDLQEFKQRMGVFPLYQLRLARLGNLPPKECGIAAAILTATHGLNNELAGISASLAPGYADGEQKPEAIDDKLDMLAAAFLSIAEIQDQHQKLIGKLIDALLLDGIENATKQ